MRFFAVGAREPNWLQLARNLLKLWLCDGGIFRKSEMNSGANMNEIWLEYGSNMTVVKHPIEDWIHC